MAWWKTAEVGDKVQCINDFFLDYLGNPVCDLEFRKGAVLTIKIIHCKPDFDPGIGLEFEGYYYHYNPTKFRPIQPKSTETGMKALKSILNGQRVPEVA